MRVGRFITFEGIDGAGKSTHIEAIKTWLEQQGEQVVLTREPGGTKLGESVRSLFLEHKMQPRTEALLVFAARREHLELIVWPALKRGAWVLCDRFTDATFAYQGGGRQLGAPAIQALADWTHEGFRPDLTLLFDLPPLEAQGRMQGRETRDRIEAEAADFHERVRAMYLARAAFEPERMHVIDSGRSKAEVSAEVLAAVQGLYESGKL